MDIKSKAKSAVQPLIIFAEKNYLMIGYIVVGLLIELMGVAVTAGKFYMTEPWFYFTFIIAVSLISMYIPNHTGRYALFVTALAANFVLDLIFVIIFDSTGTVFDFAMINLRGDAMTIMESVPINFAYVFVSGILIALYCTFGQMLKKYMPSPRSTKAAMAVTASLLAVILSADTLLIVLGNYKNDSNDLSYKLYGTETGTYSNKGIVGNLANELARGVWFSDIKIGSRDELTSYIYRQTAEPTYMFQQAYDYNVVTVLCESFEWFTFLYDEERYPNGYAKPILDLKADAELGKPKVDGDGEEIDIDAEIAKIRGSLRELYPNLYRFYESDSTVVLDNSYSLEKTDISENKSILGNYPLFQYINYAYPENSLPYSLPNIMKELFDVESNSFHNGYKTFYNRDVHHTRALGFESYTAMEDMGCYEEDVPGVGERNLDSLMLETCKEKMFPTDRRFNTYITTITQHGQYAFRENLKPYYDKMDELGILPLKENDENANALRYYCAAGMDFDKAIGIMLDYLEENGLADKTLITLFGDHNSYYQGISNYVKNINSHDVPDYTELYRVPVMIKIGNNDLGNPHLTKFTCVADIYPTILDLLGVKSFTNLTYGTSAFSDQSSILYSRAYDRFVTDKMYFNTLSSITYKAPDVDDKYIAEVSAKALDLLDKISHVNRIFASDYFKGHENEFYALLRQENELL